MSQAALSDADPTPPPVQPPITDPGPCQDAPAATTLPSAPLQPPLTPETLDLPETNEETAQEDASVKADTPGGQADQPERPAEGQVTECDQPVSLEPDAEAAEEDAEVCSSNFSLCRLSFILLTHDTMQKFQQTEDAFKFSDALMRYLFIKLI